MKKLLLAIPPSPNNRKIIRSIDCGHEAKAGYLWQPNDFMTITSLLNDKDEVFFIDGTADALSESKFFEELKKLKVDILFFALSSVCWNSDYYFFEKTRQLFSNIPIFVLGDIFLENDYQIFILKECEGIVFNPYQLDLDKMVAIKESKDISLPGVCTKPGQEVFGGKKKITYAATKNVVRHEIFLKPKYCFPFAKKFKFATVTTTWGCPFLCSYCPNSETPPIIRPYEDVLKELEYLDNLSIKELFFADKTFGFFHKNSLPLLEEMIKKFKFSWSCYFHPQTYNPNLLELMSKAGCHTIIVGIDSADMPSLKQYNRNVSQQKLDELIAHANKLNMSICADFILGLEHENEGDIINTLEYGIKLPIDFASFNIAAPMPGSDIRKKAIKEGRFTFGQEGYDSFGRLGILGTEKVSGEKIEKLRRKAVIKFYMRPKYFLRRLKKTSSWEHFRIQFLMMVSLLKKS